MSPYTCMVLCAARQEVSWTSFVKRNKEFLGLRDLQGTALPSMGPRIYFVVGEKNDIAFATLEEAKRGHEQKDRRVGIHEREVRCWLGKPGQMLAAGTVPVLH